MPVKLYATAMSPPCRAVWMLLDTLDVEFEWIEIKPGQGDTKTPEYLKVRTFYYYYLYFILYLFKLWNIVPDESATYGSSVG